MSSVLDDDALFPYRCLCEFNDRSIQAMHFNLKGIILAVTNRKYEILFVDPYGVKCRYHAKINTFQFCGGAKSLSCLAKQDKITLFRQVKIK